MTRTLEASLSVWQELADHFSTAYHQPDLEALEIFCAAVASHYLKSESPVWPIVIGPPSTGKTEICVLPFSYNGDTHLVGDLTPKAFLSGTGGTSGSFLRQCGDSAIWLVKDLGTLLSKREQDAREVFGIWREIYDGSFSRRVGGSRIPTWKGKITILAASTPFLDRAYDFINELGDRFVFVRWHRGNVIQQGRVALRRIGSSLKTYERSRHLVKSFVHEALSSPPHPLPEQFEDQLLYLAESAARLRTRVMRDTKNGNREIIEVPESEGIARLAKCMAMLTSFRSALFGKSNVDNDDMRIARRVAFDSVPPSRLRFIRAMMLDGDAEWTDVQKQSNLPKSSMNWIDNELQHLNIIEKWDGASVSYRFTDDFREIWRKAGNDL